MNGMKVRPTSILSLLLCFYSNRFDWLFSPEEEVDARVGDEKHRRKGEKKLLVGVLAGSTQLLSVDVLVEGKLALPLPWTASTAAAFCRCGRQQTVHTTVHSSFFACF